MSSEFEKNDDLSSFTNLSYMKNENNLTFFSSIDEATKEWLKSLEQIWQICKCLLYYTIKLLVIVYPHNIFWPIVNYKFLLGKKGDIVNNTLIEYFESAPEPYLSTIRLLVNTSDFKHIKRSSSLAFTGLVYK